jgi:hypothetical protein
MKGIPWVLAAILVTLVLLGIVVVVAIRKSGRENGCLESSTLD